MTRFSTPDPDPGPSLAQPFRLFLATIAVTMAAVGAINLVAGKFGTGSVAVCLVTATVLSWVIADRGDFRLAAGLLFYSLALGLTAFLWVGNGMRDYGIAGYPAVLFAGCVFLGATAYWGLAALVFSSVVILGTAELLGLVRNAFSAHLDLRSLVNLWLLIGASAVGGRVLMKAIQSAATRELALSGALQDSEATVQKFFRSSHSAIAISRLADGAYIDVNDAYLEMFGLTREQVIGRTSYDAGIWEDRHDRDRLLQQLREGNTVKDFEARLRKSSGEVMENVLAAEVLEIRGEPCLLSSVTDVTSRLMAERRAEILSTRDSLTGLPNRVLALDRLDNGIEVARRHGSVIALFHVDLDRFKTINESFGYGEGDAVLREACSRVQSVLGKGDTLARLGSDEFLVIAPSLRDASQANAIAAKITGAFDEPFAVRDHAIRLSCSTGVALCPDDARDPETLLRYAESAMHLAKVEGRGRWCRFDRVLSERVRDRLVIETSLRECIVRRELHLAYQPKFDMHSKEITGVEALCRWTHPTHGEVSPARFVAIAEESDLIHELGLWVLREACAQIERWQRDGMAGLPIAVNLSAGQLNPALPAIVSGCIAQAHVDPERIEFEVTESMLITRPEATRKVLEQISDDGGRIVLDDFGVGYSSLNYIKHLPLDGLKIDRSFVRDIAQSRLDAAIVTAIVTLARGLGLRVVAEGIEFEAQFQAMNELGCDEAQGFFLGSPMKGEEIAARYLRH